MAPVRQRVLAARAERLYPPPRRQGASRLERDDDRGVHTGFSQSWAIPHIAGQPSGRLISLCSTCGARTGVMASPSAGDFAAGSVLRRLCVFGARADGIVPGDRRDAPGLQARARVEHRDGGAILGRRGRGIFSLRKPATRSSCAAKFAQGLSPAFGQRSGNSRAARLGRADGPKRTARLRLRTLSSAETLAEAYRSRAAQILSAFGGGHVGHSLRPRFI